VKLQEIKAAILVPGVVSPELKNLRIEKVSLGQKGPENRSERRETLTAHGR